MLKQETRKLQVIHLSLVMGMVSFAVIAVFLHYINGPLMKLQPEDSSPWVAAAIILMPFLAGIGLFLFRKMVAAAVAVADEGMRFQRVRTAWISRMALTEFPVLFCLVLFLLTGSFYLLPVALTGIALMAALFPSDVRMKKYLQADDF